jgi:hypothetical protein
VESGVAELGDVMLSVLIKVNAPTAVGSSALTLSVKPSLVSVIIVGEMGGKVYRALPRVMNILNPVPCGTNRMNVMKYYTSTTEFNCGIDLHARQMYVCLMDRQGKKLVHTNIKNNDFAYFLQRIEPYKHDLTVCCECMFGWYWLADACQAAGLTFVLAHALYLKAIHGGKNKNDRIDSEKIAHLLRSNLIPSAYVYPGALRPLRALLRQRILYVWRRSDLLARIHSHQLAHNRPTLRQSRSNRDPWEKQLLAAEDHPLRQLALQNDMAMVRHYDEQIAALETQLKQLTRDHRAGDPAQERDSGRGRSRLHPVANSAWHWREPRPHHSP